MRGDAMTLYELGRALAAEEEAKLDNYDTETGETCAERVRQIGAEIEAIGGWAAEGGAAERGYFDARREYAQERAA
jgi:hypothetical protein